MCMGSSKYQKRAAQAQTAALESLAAAQRARTTDMVSRTNSIVKTNKDAQKKSIYSLRIPLNKQNEMFNLSDNTSYGLNIPL